jgi:hypothetical protein
MREHTRLKALFGLVVLVGCGGGSEKLSDHGANGAAGSVIGGATASGSIGGDRAEGGRGASLGGDGGTTADSTGGTAPIPSTSCAKLPPSTGTVVNVTPADAARLHELTFNAASGTTFVLAPGTYAIADSLRLERADMTLRSSTDRAADVIVDAAYTVAEAIVIRASNATVAHITVTRAVDHAIHVSPPSEGVDLTGVLVYGVALTDSGEQFLKVNPLGSAAGYVDAGRVECSTFQLTDAGRPHVERAVGGCYTGGIDVHAARDWIVRRNRFEGIYCAGEGLAEHAIHFWKRSRATLVENNVIVNCARGIGFGMGDADTGTRVYADAPYGGDLGHIDGIVRNNVIYADIDYFDTGIEIIQARQPLLLHNTVVSWKGFGFFSSLDYRFGRTQAVIQNNLVRRITLRDGASGTVDHNLQETPESYFVDPTRGDFHLTASASDAIDRGVTLTEAGLDIDGEPHTHGAPDLGADER